ncbi:MAG: hypothetical protein KF777_04315 [Planctomycetaceae bacterium]|nr:hypothetical protein [Planctomycetaceae bacterium]
MSSASIPIPPDESPPLPPLATASPFGSLAKYITNHNPFYPLSAVFILLGLHGLFHDEEAARNITEVGFNNTILWLVFAGYSIVLAATAVWVVRWGRIWDDARTLLLTLVLLLVAMSVNCDKPISLHVPIAPYLLAGGLAFAIVLSEVTLRLTRIHFPWCLRVPMYLFFSLFFLYPLVLDHSLNVVGLADNAAGLRQTLLGVMLFPAAAGLVTLTLLPAAWRGRDVAVMRQTPWIWPAYPWSLFVAMGIAVVLRAFYLTISFHPRSGTVSEFAPYFLTPFVIPVAMVVFELGRSVGYRMTQNLALAVPLVCVPLSLTGAPVAIPEANFLHLHAEYFGSPLQVALVGLVALHVYALFRSGPAWTIDALIGLTALAAVVGPHTFEVETFGPTNGLPLLAATALSIWQGIRAPHHSRYWILGAGLLLLATNTFLWNTLWTSSRGAIPWHLAMIAMLAASVIWNDSLARMLGQLAAAMAVAFVFGAAILSARSLYGLTPPLAMTYLIGMAFPFWGAWWMSRQRDHLTAAIMVTTAAGLYLGLLAGSLLLLSRNPMAWASVLGGLICFAAGLAVSARKMRMTSELTNEPPPMTGE